jgi:hypothetical protein
MSMPFHLRLTEGGFGSIRLMFVSWLFKVGGIIFGITTIAVLIALVLGISTPNGPKLQLAALLIVAAMAVALFSAGQMLARHQRRGAVLGLALTLYPFVLAPLTGAAMNRIDIAVTAVTAILVLSVWRELTWRRNPTTA